MELAVIGILITLAGGVSSAIGWALQKKAHNLAKEKDGNSLNQTHWWVGMAMILLTQPLNLGKHL